MSKNEVLKILEYKNHKDIDYVLVLWNDNTTSWTGVLSLKCKDLICGFVKDLIGILKKEERSVAEKDRIMKEERILNSILMKNLQDSTALEVKQADFINKIIDNKGLSAESNFGRHDFQNARNTKMQSNVINQPRNKNDSRILNDFYGKTGFKNQLTEGKLHSSSSISKEEEYLKSRTREDIFYKNDEGNRSIENVSMHRFNNSYDRMQSSKIEETFKNFDISKNHQKAKKVAIQKSTVNSLFIKIDHLNTISIDFFYNSVFPVINLDVEAASFVKFDFVAARLYSYFLNGSGYSFFPSVDSVNSLKTNFEVLLKKEDLVMIQKNGDFVWIVLPCSSNFNLFKIPVDSKFFIFKIENDQYFEELSKMRNFMSLNSQWIKSTFRIGGNLLSDYLYRNVQLPLSKSIFIFGDPRSTQHLSSFAKNKGELTSKIAFASLILIQKQYMDFLHLLPGFYDSLRNHSKYFLESDNGFEEILKSGGMATFSDEFVMNAELMSISDFIDIISMKPGWEIKVRQSTYSLLKRRLASQQTAPEYLYKIKNIYKVFKSSIVDDCANDLRSYLEGRYYRSHRFFLEISSLEITECMISIEDATRLVKSAF